MKSPSSKARVMIFGSRKISKYAKKTLDGFNLQQGPNNKSTSYMVFRAFLNYLMRLGENKAAPHKFLEHVF